ncbi:MAG: nitrate/nitrite transporter NrtS [Geminicoccaceae bacterium]
MTESLRVALSFRTVKVALTVALIVGPILTLINQGDSLFGEGRVNFWKMALTFCVPYLVSTTSTVLAHRDRAR